MRRAEKAQIIAELRDKLQRASSAVLTDYKGLTVAEITRLRNMLAEEQVEFRVIKNTLMRLASQDTNAALFEPLLTGTNALAIGYGDPSVPARILQKFAKENEKLRIKAGILGEKLLNEQEIKALAELPSREQLLAMVLSLLQAAPRGLVTVLSGVPRALLNVLTAIRDRKEEG